VGVGVSVFGCVREIHVRMSVCWFQLASAARVHLQHNAHTHTYKYKYVYTQHTCRQTTWLHTYTHIHSHV